MEYYWEIIRRDEPPILIPPDAVDTVKKRWDAGQPIHTTSGSVPHHQILDFRISTTRYTTQPLLEEVSQAFNEPMVEDGNVAYKWVKKLVPGRMYQKHYSAIPAYRKLSEQSGMVWIAFKQPVHQIDSMQVDVCTEVEVSHLT